MSLTTRQQAALDRIREGGTADKGMLEALRKKGYLGSEMAECLTREASKPAPQPESKPVVQDGLPDYTKRTWNTLGDLVERIERDGVEEIEMFNGFQIVTSNRIYGLAFGELTVTAVEEAA
jgi:hypothetical protein